MGLFTKLLPLLTGAGTLVIGKAVAGMGVVENSAKAGAALKLVEGQLDASELADRRKMEQLGINPELIRFQKAEAKVRGDELDPTAWVEFELAQDLLSEEDSWMAGRWFLMRSEMVLLTAEMHHRNLLQRRGSAPALLEKICSALELEYGQVAAAVTRPTGISVAYLRAKSDARLADEEFLSSVRS